MRFMIKLLGLLGIVGATAATAIAIDRKRRMLTGGGAPARASDVMGYREVAIIDAEIVGIAEVDPAKLTQMGEAIDPELTKAAHEEIPDQRAKLPKR